MKLWFEYQTGGPHTTKEITLDRVVEVKTVYNKTDGYWQLVVTRSGRREEFFRSAYIDRWKITETDEPRPRGRHPHFSAVEREELIEAHRPFWDELKESRSVWGKNSIKNGFPELEGSLRSLHIEQGYCLTDISMMFGVSRERVRQWCRTLGVPVTNYSFLTRVWDDSLSMFRILRRDEILQERWLEVELEKEERSRVVIERQSEREELVISTIRDLDRAKKGKGVFLREVADALVKIGCWKSFSSAFSSLYRISGHNVDLFFERAEVTRLDGRKVSPRRGRKRKKK